MQNGLFSILSLCQGILVQVCAVALVELVSVLANVVGIVVETEYVML